jgi:hypothetical protein
MTTSHGRNEGQGSLPIDGRLITKSRNENVDGVAFVSGTQGVICTTFTVEEVHLITGESRLKPVCGSAALVTHWDISTIEDRTLNWRVC